MSFSNSELQQLRALVRTQLDKHEIDRIGSKEVIADMVQQKQPFKLAGTKSVVDKINDSIRDEYRVLDQTEKKLKKLVKLQQAIKRELQGNAEEGRLAKEQSRFNDLFEQHFHNAPPPNEALVKAMDRLRNPENRKVYHLADFADNSASCTGLQNTATTGYSQVEGSQTQAVASVLTTTTDNPSDGFLPQGWSDYKMEDFRVVCDATNNPFDQFKPAVRTLELRYEDLPTYIGKPDPKNPDPSYDQPALDSRWYTTPNRIINPGFEVTQSPVDVSAKPSNPKDMIGSGKLPIHLWPNTATAMGCIGFLNGMLKYGRSNFRIHGIRASIYYDAAKRHLDAWFEGEETDPDDGVPHLAAALACIAIIVDAQAAGKFNDDRAVAGGYRALVERLTPQVAYLKKLHAAKEPKHYTIADNA